MKTGFLIAAVFAIVLTGFAAPAAADELGEKLANVLCYGAAGYKLLPQEEAAWKDAHTGSFSGGSPGITYMFSKSAGTDSAICTWRRSIPPESGIAQVRKSGSMLSRTDYAQTTIE